MGNKLYYVESIDNLPPRAVLDTVMKDHGQSLINFCLHTNTCIVNGRVCPLNDSFTSVSHRSRAVVDYILTANDNIYDIDWFKVYFIGDIIADFSLKEEGACKASNHHMILCIMSLKWFSEVLMHDDSQLVQNGINEGAQHSNLGEQ